MGSPKQIQEILFDKLELPVLQKTPKGAPGGGYCNRQQLESGPSLKLAPREVRAAALTLTTLAKQKTRPNPIFSPMKIRQLFQLRTIS